MIREATAPVAKDALGQIDPQLPAHGARQAFQRFQCNRRVVRIEQAVDLGTAGLEPFGELHLAERGGPHGLMVWARGSNDRCLCGAET